MLCMANVLREEVSKLGLARAPMLYWLHLIDYDEKFKCNYDELLEVVQELRKQLAQLNSNSPDDGAYVFWYEIYQTKFTITIGVCYDDYEVNEILTLDVHRVQDKGVR